MPPVDGTVFAVAPDGSGGCYIGGTFTKVGSTTRNNLAHINAVGTLDATWNPDANYTVRALTVSSGIVYAGGDFTTLAAGTVTRNYIAALDATTGAATTWNPNANGPVNALAVSDDTVYAGGDFTYIDGQTRNYIAALNATTGAATAWNPNAEKIVSALAVFGSVVYAGGDFTKIGANSSQPTRNYIAALDATTGAVTAWDPNANAPVHALAVFALDSIVYAGGAFTNIGGQSRRRIAALNDTDGAATASWDPNANAPVDALAVSGSTVYAGGAFTNIGGQSRRRIAALNGSGNAKDWNPKANASVLALAASDTTVYAGGGFSSTGGVTRNRIAALDATTGAATSWNPNANGSVSALAVSGTTVYAGGGFTTLAADTVTRNYIAALDATTGAATSWNPNANYAVLALAVSGTTVYAGGGFTTLAGGTVTRNYIAALDATTGAASITWNPNADNTVFALATSGTTVYAGGDFATIGGEDRYCIAALDATTGDATDWDPDPDTTVVALAVSGNTVYAGGGFTTLAADTVTRNYIAALDATTGLATTWNPNANGFVFALATSGTTVYAGGDFTTLAGGTVTRNRIAALDATTGAATTWNPNAGGSSVSGRALAVFGTTVYAGGSFTTIGGVPWHCLAAFRGSGPTTYNIDPSAGPNGSISPATTQAVASGADQTFTISADPGYHIADVLVDGGSVGALASYTFPNVTATHTIAASFAVTPTPPSPPPPAGPLVTSFSPAAGPPGTVVTIEGSGLWGATAVSFNGSPAAFTVNGSTRLTATVPAGATSGLISVSSPSGSGSSASAFNVTGPPPEITVTAPSGTGSYLQGGLLPVAWTTSSATWLGEFGLWVRSPGDAWYLAVTLPVSGGTSFSTTLALTVPPGSGYQAIVAWRPTTGSGGWLAWGTSPGSFTVTGLSLAVTAPTGTSTYAQGASLPVAWTTSSATASGEFGLWVRSAGDAWYLATTVPASGGTSFSTTLAVAVPPGSGYQAIVAWRPTTGSGGWLAWGTSPGSFTVTGLTLAVTAPAGSASYAQGAALSVAWTTSSATASGEFGLWVRSSADAWYLATTLPASGGTSFAATLTLGVPPDSGYRAIVAWRPVAGAGTWVSWGTSPGSFTVTAR